MNGAAATVDVKFTQAQYKVTFEETGLASGTKWTVDVGTGPKTVSGTGTSLSLTLANGTYTWTASASGYDSPTGHGDGERGYGHGHGDVRVAGPSTGLERTITVAASLRRGPGVGPRPR